MRILLALGLSLVLGACHAKRDAANAAFADYSLSYTRVVAREAALHTAMTSVQDAFAALGDAGKPLSTELDALLRRSRDVEDLVDRADEQAKAARLRIDAEALRGATGALDAASKQESALENDVAVLRAKMAATQPGTADAGTTPEPVLDAATVAVPADHGAPPTKPAVPNDPAAVPPKP